ncbi:T9SS type A sorting domain-containing protein [bacterium]|nr:T9SS type A sorting domain-containing protein [bacterium]
MYRYAMSVLVSVVLSCGMGNAQTINEYTVKRTAVPPVIDGHLTEAAWEEAATTGTFVVYTDGAMAVYPTRAKMLWDDTSLYIAFICEDPDVWATYTAHDAHLWEEEVTEIFIDPDGDGLDYLEFEISPLGTLLDLRMTKAYSEGGKSDFAWNLDGFTAGIGVEGTLNDKSDTDVRWICEAALPFKGLAFTAPTMNFPPKNGDAWRLNLYRYEYIRAEGVSPELTAWNQTDKRGFHAPDKFGRVIFSDETLPTQTSVDRSDAPGTPFGITGNYPNPFNPSTEIGFSVPSAGYVSMDVFNILGQHIGALVSGYYSPGIYSAAWSGKTDKGMSVPSGIYFVRLQMGEQVVSHRMLLMR